MGFHKRYITDHQVIEVFTERGYQGIINYFTKGVDAIITSGDLSEHVYDILHLDLLSTLDKETKISKLILQASQKISRN